MNFKPVPIQLTYLDAKEKKDQICGCPFCEQAIQSKQRMKANSVCQYCVHQKIAKLRIFGVGFVSTKACLRKGKKIVSELEERRRK